MIGIIDYGVGNLFSLKSSFEAIGIETFVSGCREELSKADKLVLPGVGAFGDAAQKLRSSGLDVFVREQAAKGVPLLGICLGMQLLFEKSYEYGVHTGLGILKGEVVPMNTRLPLELKVPHMGWNSVNFSEPKHPLFKDLGEHPYFYFVHSYHCVPEDGSVITAVTEYGEQLTAAVAKDNVMATQFHPEKSGDVGLQVLKNFIEM